MNDAASADLFIPDADKLMCSLLPNSPKYVTYSKGITLQIIEKVKMFLSRTIITFMILYLTRWSSIQKRTK